MALKTDIKSQLRRFSQPMWDGKKRLTAKEYLFGVSKVLRYNKLGILFVTNSPQADHCILDVRKLVSLLKRSLKNVEVKVEHRSLDLERNDFDFHLPWVVFTNTL